MIDTMFVCDGETFCCAKCAPCGATECPTGETDCPSHCAECGELIPEPLTTEGVEYVIEAIDEHYESGRGDRDVLQQWADFIRDYCLDPLQTETLVRFETGEPDIDDRCSTLQELIDSEDARADEYLANLIDRARDSEGDSENLLRLCLLELLRENGDDIGPDDIEHVHGDLFGIRGRYVDGEQGRFKMNASEYRVMTDHEADTAWDESLEQYIDACILPELPEHAARYFDREAWKRDARHDGRGHCLASYDGDERDAREFVVFRVN